MIKVLIKSTNEFRLETIESVKEFEQELRNKAKDKGYTVGSFGYTKKEAKAQGEVVDEWYIVKYTCVFNDPKKLECPEFNDVVFNKLDTIDYQEDM